MIITKKQKLVNSIYIFLSLSPLAYLIAFISFLYYTGNGFGRDLTYNPQPAKKETYLVWLRLISELENFWIVAFFLWVLMLIITIFFLGNIRTKAFVITTIILFVTAIYMSFFSKYGGHEGWIDDYWEAVNEINRS